MRNFLQAINLLTRIPVHVRWDTNRPLGQTLAWAPAVGLLIGGLLLAAAWALAAVIPAGSAPLLVPALLLALWVLLTGGLHLDGWCDSCDGLFVTADREKRLEIMKDPRAGSFGVIGTVLLLLVKFAALQGVMRAGMQAPVGWLPLLAAPVAARGLMIATVAWLPLARPGGMGAKFREGLGTPQLLIAGVFMAVVLAACGRAGMVCGLAALAAAAVWATLAMRRLGGLTGDIYGAITELAETAALVAVCCVKCG